MKQPWVYMCSPSHLSQGGNPFHMILCAVPQGLHHLPTQDLKWGHCVPKLGTLTCVRMYPRCQFLPP